MKKILLILTMLTMSIMTFANGGRITSQINTGMTRESLEKAINKNSIPELNIVYNANNGIYFYENVTDPLGITREIASFNFVDNKLSSAIFDSPSTDQVHKEIYDYYVKNQKKFQDKFTVMKDDKHQYLLMYNNNITLVVEKIIAPNGEKRTFITVHKATPEIISLRIEMFNNLKENR